MNRCDRLRASLALVLAVVITTSFSGCYSRTEIEMSGFVLAMGLDRGHQKPIRLVAQLAVPAAIAGENDRSRGGQQRAVLLTAEGNTVSEAILELEKVTPHRLFWGHADLIVMTTEFAKQGLFRETDLFLREREFRPGGSVFITDNELEDVLSAEFPTQPGNATYVQRLIDLVATHSMSPKVLVAEFGAMIEAGLVAKLVPMIKVDESTASGGQGNSQKVLRLEGAGVVSRDGLIDELTATETRGALWVTGTAGETIITMENPGPYVGSMSLRILRSWPTVRIYTDTEQIENSKVAVVITGEADVMEAEMAGVNLTSEELGKVDTELSSAIEREIVHALHRMQEIGVDALDLAELFRRSMPADRWREVKNGWESVFRELEFSVSVDIRIRRRGMSA